MGEPARKITIAGEDTLHSFFGELTKNWPWVLGTGVLFIALGALGLGITGTVTLASVVVFGFLMVIGGIFQLVETFYCRRWQGVLYHVLTGLAYLAAGAYVVSYPLAGSAALTLILGAAIAGIGIVRAIMGFQMRGQEGWGWIVMSGLLSMVFGSLVLQQWPESALWVIGLFVSLDLLFHGFAYVGLALAARAVRHQLS